MTSDGPLLLESGDLSVRPERGELRNARGESARLGPVNMKVLTLLMRRSGQVVSRAEIFDSVWKNQIVGDDTLTRAISDIRAELGRLSDHAGLIETVPKRGYRWTVDVRETQPLAAPAPGTMAATSAPATMAATSAEAAMAATGAPGPTAAGPGPTPPGRQLLAWGGRGAVYAAALLAIASLAVWLMSELAGPGRQIVAVLPIAAEPARRELAAGIEQQLADYLLALGRVDLLSRSAVESRPSNPFPYFYYEFGASWLIETQLKSMSGKAELTVTVVDARTGIVLLQSTATVGHDASPSAADVEPALLPLKTFFESQASR